MTTLPVLRTPIHMSYVLYLATYSSGAGATVFSGSDQPVSLDGSASRRFCSTLSISSEATRSRSWRSSRP